METEFNPTKAIAFTFLFVGAWGAFAWSVSRLAKYLLRGNHADPWPRFDRVGQRLWDFVLYFILQKKVAEPVSYTAAKKGITSWHHLLIFWGFLIIQIGALEMFIQGFSGGAASLAFLGEPIYRGIKLLIDWFNVLVLAMVLYGYFRRIVLKPRLIPMSGDAAIVLGLIGFLMVSHFLHHAFGIAASEALEQKWQESSFSAILAAPLANGSVETNAMLSQVFWWAHVSTILFFLNYIPYSKHIHLLGSGPNIVFRNLDARVIGTKRDLENENDWGVGKVEQFTWKQLLDGYACTECARCSNFCPAFNTDKPLSPFKIIQDIKHEMVDVGRLKLEIARLQGPGAATGEGDKAEAQAAGGNGANATQIAALQKQLDEMKPLVGGRIEDEELWSCTTCGACQEVCPVFIEHPRAIVDMRTHLVLTESRMPAELGRMFTNLERNSNPWGIAADKRMDWTSGLPETVVVPTIADKPDAEYLLFVGCAASFDDRIQKTMRSFVECLHAAGVSFAVLGPEEQCSGDPARRGGNEYLYQAQAQANVDAMNAAKVRKVVASCPHCFHTLKNEYPAFGGKYEVVHHSQLLAHLLETGKLKPETPVGKRFTYHDSCYLGRWNGEYDAPRKVVEVMAGLEKDGVFTELDRKKNHGFCCGGGGARMWMEEKIGTRVNRNRSAEIIGTGAEVAAVACPFCTIMISDGVKDAGAEEKVKVLDVAELIAKSIKTGAVKAPASTTSAS